MSHRFHVRSILSYSQGSIASNLLLHFKGLTGWWFFTRELLIQVALALISNHKSTDMHVEEHQGHVSSSQLRGIEILQCLLLFGDNNYLGSVFFFLVEKLINLSRQTISKKPSWYSCGNFQRRNSITKCTQLMFWHCRDSSCKVNFENVLDVH